MKIIFMASMIISGLSLSTSLNGQKADTIAMVPWEHSIAFNFYFFQDPFIFLPTYEANHGKLHLAARYNYEDLNTFSGWVGYNFNGGTQFEYVITPMAGAVIGQTNGFAGGAVIQLDFNRFSFYSESEYVFDVSDHRNDYFYSWTDLAYSAFEWLDIGLSIQRTRLYQTNVDVQSGILVGSTIYGIDVTGYLYNPFIDDPFFIISLSRDF